MNGDYSIQLILSGIHSVKVIWIKNKKAKGVFDEIDLLYFVRQLLSAASLALNHVQKKVTSILLKTFPDELLRSEVLIIKSSSSFFSRQPRAAGGFYN